MTTNIYKKIPPRVKLRGGFNIVFLFYQARIRVEELKKCLNEVILRVYDRNMYTYPKLVIATGNGTAFFYSIILPVPFHTALFPKDPLYLLLRAARTVSIIVMIESVVDLF